MGYEVLLIGRKSKRNFTLKDLPFATLRFHNPFKKGPAMYGVFQLQLGIYLLFKKSDMLWSNDLDTLLPNYIISRLKGIPLVYDSHEYFTESVYKKFSKKVWEKLEHFLFPRLKNVITVNDSIREIYEKKYGVPVSVLRNVPYRYVPEPDVQDTLAAAGKKILVMQGMGINENRGAEEAVLAMQYLPEDFHLYFIGGGTILDKLKRMVHDAGWERRVIFVDALPYRQMMGYTRQCFLGLILEKTDLSGEHLLALPNRLFDYIQAGIPVLSSEGVEIKKIITKYGIGDCIRHPDPREIAARILEISEDRPAYALWKYHTRAAAAELNWENEEKVLITFMENLT
jgi:glycosyltransferase involved in cell wall biosynthesis